MPNEIQTQMQNIFINTIGSWEKCTLATIEAFLEQCQKNNIDPQYCMTWVEQHKDEIPNWSVISKESLDWVNQNTSTSSPISFDGQETDQ